MNPELTSEKKAEFRKIHEEKCGTRHFIKRDKVIFPDDIHMLSFSNYNLKTCTWLGKEILIPVTSYFLDLEKIPEQDLPKIVNKCHVEDRICLNHISREEGVEDWLTVCNNTKAAIQETKQQWNQSSIIGKIGMLISFLTEVSKGLFMRIPDIMLISATLYGAYLLCSYTYKGAAYVVSKIEIPERIMQSALESAYAYLPNRTHSL